MAVRYRFARPGDEDQIAAMVTRAWQVAYRGLIDDVVLDTLDPAERADNLRDGLPAAAQEANAVTWVVAEEDERILGHGISRVSDGLGHLMALYVDPDAWGRGIGHQLHTMALRGLRRRGADAAQLEVLDGNERTIAFYERHGWSLTGDTSVDEMYGAELTHRRMRIDLALDVLGQNDAYWTGQAADYARWQSWPDDVRWGIFAIPDEAVTPGGIFPAVAGLDVVELGCGTGYVSNWAIQRGAHSVVGLDATAAQLATAARWARDHEVMLPLVRADAQRLPFADDSFDLAINEYGAAIWCDPRVWIPEAARVLRPGGRVWFLGNSVQLMLCAPEFEDELATPTLVRPQRDMHRMAWIDTDNVEYHVSHGEMISILTGAGFAIEALHELYAPPDAPPSSYGLASGEWAGTWPIEEVWVARLPA